MYYHGRPIYTIPEYIYRKMKASANIYIIEYAEAFIFQIHPLAFYLRFLFVTGACMPISRPKLEVHYVLSWPAIPEYIPDGGFFQFLCNRIRSYPHITYAWVYTIEDGVFFHYFIYRLRRRHHFQIHIQLPFFYDSLANLLSLFLHSLKKNKLNISEFYKVL
jgi:hypothetical protein